MADTLKERCDRAGFVSGASGWPEKYRWANDPLKLCSRTPLLYLFEGLRDEWRPVEHDAAGAVIGWALVLAMPRIVICAQPDGERWAYGQSDADAPLGFAPSALDALLAAYANGGGK